MIVFKKILLLILCLLISTSAYGAIESGGGSLEDYVPYVGAINDLNLGSKHFITTGDIAGGKLTIDNMIVIDNSQFYRVGGGEIFMSTTQLRTLTSLTANTLVMSSGQITDSTGLKINSTSNLKLMSTAAGDISCFEDTDVGNTSDGKKFTVWRKAAEGDSSFSIYGRNDKDVIIETSYHTVFKNTYWDGRFYFYPNNGTDALAFYLTSEAGQSSFLVKSMGRNYLVLATQVSNSGAVMPDADAGTTFGYLGGGANNRRWKAGYFYDGTREAQLTNNNAAGYFQDTINSYQAYICESSSYNAAGYFDYSGGSSYAYLATSSYGIYAHSPSIAGCFDDSSGNYAYIADGSGGGFFYGGSYGLQATNGSDSAYLAYSGYGGAFYGISGGCYGYNSNSTYGYLAYNGYGVYSDTNSMDSGAGYFYYGGTSDYVYLCDSTYALYSYRSSSNYAAYFSDSNSDYAYFCDNGSYVGYFYDSSTITYTYILDGSYGLNTTSGINTSLGYYINGTAGVSGTFTSNDGKTITVTNGIITSIV